MPLSILSPFEVVKPGQILSQYLDWIYFTLVLVFFLAVAGLTLRRHFDLPYVKPLIIAVGLMLTVAVFLKREWLVMLFEGWGIIGTMIMVAVIAIIPYGLARGLGLSAGKAFYGTYILMYLLSWVKFSIFFEGLSEHNMGIINLGLLLLFFYAVYQLIPFGHASKLLKTGFKERFADKFAEIDREIESQRSEAKTVAGEAWPLTKREIKTVGEMSEGLAEIQLEVERWQNNLNPDDRSRISKAIGNILRKEGLFRDDLTRLQRVVSKLAKVDSDELEKMKKRLNSVKDDERVTLRAEIQKEELKLQAEKEVGDCDQRLAQGIEAFHRNLTEAAGIVIRSQYPLDSKPFMARARVVLKDIMEILKDIKRLEDRLVALSQDERRVLKQEKKVAA